MKERTESELLASRQNHALPILTRQRDWLTQQKTRSLPTSPIGLAIEDALSNFDALTRYASPGV